MIGTISTFHRTLCCACLAAITSPLAAAQADVDGVWKSDISPQINRYSAMAFDAAHDRVVLFGGVTLSGDASNRTFLVSRSPNPHVTALDAVDPADSIPAYDGASLIVDPVRDRVVLFGGQIGSTNHNDTWTLSFASGSKWTRLVTSGTLPTARHGHSAMYDPLRDRMLVVGGSAGNRMWALSLSGSPTWSQITPIGGTPGPAIHNAFYDPTNDRVVLFAIAGTSGLGIFNFATGGANTPTYATYATTGTPPSSIALPLALDPVSQTIAVLDGCCPDGFYTYQVAISSLSLSTLAWSPVTTAGPQPTWRDTKSSSYDPIRREALLGGGLNMEWVASVPRTGLWGLSFGGPPTWTEIYGDLNPPMITYAGFYDGKRDQFLVGGSRVDGHGAPSFNDHNTLDLTDTHGWHETLNFNAFAGTQFTYLIRHDQVFLAFGGYDYAYSLGAEPQWSPTGSVPPSGRWFSMAVDTRRDQLLLFGVTPDGGPAQNNIWQLSLTGGHAWTQLAPAGPLPPARYASSLMYDPVRDRLILFGGNNPPGTGLNDLWAMNLSGSPAWTQLSPSGTPPPGNAYAVFYDPVRDRMVARQATGTWALSLDDPPAWSALSPTGAAPDPSSASAAASTYDPVRDRMLVQVPASSWPAFNTFSSTWVVDWGEPAHPHVTCPGETVAGAAGGTANLSYPVANPLDSPRAIGWKLECNRNWPGFPQYSSTVIAGSSQQSIPLSFAVPDTVTPGGAITFTAWYEGGFGNNESCTSVVVPGVLPVPAQPALRLALEGPRANPTRRLDVSFVLPDERPAMLDAFDVSGRRISHQDLSHLGPGRHTAAAGGLHPAAGVYLLRLTHGEDVVTARAVVIR